MLSRRMLPQIVTVRRHTDVLDSYKTPTSSPDGTLVGTYPCRLTRSGLNAEQAEPATELSENYRLYAPAYAQMQAGDTAEVDGIKYRCATPYRPNGHHTEVDVWRDTEA